MSDLPTEDEINVYDSLDEKWAVKQLLGRTAEEIREELEDNFLHLSEALMHIGPVACAYYGRAAIDAAWNCAKRDADGDELSCLVGIFQLRLELDEWDVGDQPGFTDAVLALCQRVENEFDSLEIDEERPGELRQAFRDFHEKLGGPKSEPVVEPAPIATGLPTEAEMNIHDTFEEREATRTFRGLSPADVEELFARESWRVASELAALGPKAFAFYLPAAIAGARSSAAMTDMGIPSEELFLPLRGRAQQNWNLHQMLPLELEAGMRERLPEVLELLEFLERSPPSPSPSPSPNQDEDEDEPVRDRSKFFRMFRHQLEQYRDQLPRPAELADGSESEIETLSMSVDAMVFLPEATPSERDEFLDWYTSVTKWKPGRGYGDPTICDARLRAWLEDMVLEFAPIAGPLAREEKDVTRQADFCCDHSFIYFAASIHGPDPVWERAELLAAKHDLGVFWVSSDYGVVSLPDGAGELRVAHQRE